MNIDYKLCWSYVFLFCGLGFTWERVNPYMSLCLCDSESTKQWHHCSFGVRKIMIKMLDKHMAIMRSRCVINCLQWQKIIRECICVLTHLPLVPHICVSELGHHWFRYWLVACSVSSHYLNRCWHSVNWTLGNKFQWNCNRIVSFSFKKTHMKMSSAKMAAILSRERWVKCMAC